LTEPQAESETNRYAPLRWILLALGIVAIVVFAMTPRSVHRSRTVVQRPADAQSVEPAPLAFQPDVTPEDAEKINADRPDITGPIVMARPLFASRALDRRADVERATQCLAQAVYYEAASESPEGQRAVAQVVLNRVRDPRFPSSVCGVIFQGSERTTGCQFSFTCDGSMARVPNPLGFARARSVAIAALAGQVEPLVGLATHYHTKQVVPVWRTDLVKLRTVGAHIFYGWQGRDRSSRGLRLAYAGIEPEIMPSPITPGLSPDILSTIEPETGEANPFAAPVAEPRLSAPRLPTQDYGRMQADEKAGQLITGESSALDADNRSGSLNKP
jgi:spore germination cell wall hydrolase CwlJ-like protein